ncbi:MAG: hypothetical protein R3F43_06370 [bacterium]
MGADTVEALEGNLPRLDAALGILLTVGRFDDKARAAAAAAACACGRAGAEPACTPTASASPATSPFVRYVDAALREPRLRCGAGARPQAAAGGGAAAGGVFVAGLEAGAPDQPGRRRSRRC